MIKIALAQIESLSHQQAKNIEQHFDYIRTAIDKKADVIVFPELSLHGHSSGSRALELAVNDQHTLIQQLAQHSKGITSLVSGIEYTAEGLFFNTVYVLRNNDILARHRCQPRKRGHRYVPPKVGCSRPLFLLHHWKFGIIRFLMPYPAFIPYPFFSI